MMKKFSRMRIFSSGRVFATTQGSNRFFTPGRRVCLSQHYGEWKMNVLETLNAEHTELTQRLNELDERHRTERPGLVSQVSQLSKAIAALTKPAKGSGPRKSMSEEGKAAIRAGLERARAAKLASSAEAGASSSTTPSVVEQPVANPGPSQSQAKKPSSGDKAPNRVN
jgi:hypothetical protein